VAVAALGPIVFGMSLGFTSPATSSMIHGPDGLAVLKDSQSDLFGAAINIGCVVGAMVGGTVADMVGRRGGILVVMPICALAWVVTASGESLIPLMVGRLLSGVGTGAVSVVVPIYIAETAPTRLRGTLGCCNQLAVTIGILLVYMLGGYAFRTADNEYCDWRKLALAIVAPIACLFVFAFLIPETPRWYMNRGDVDRAQRSLRRLRRVESGQAMLASSGADEARRQPSLFSQEMRGKLWDCRQALRISIFLCVAQQFSGVNAVIFYQTPILQDANISWYETAAVITMVTQVIMTWVACILVDKLGRRPLFIMSMTGMAFAAFAVGVYFMLQRPGQPATAVWLLLAGSYSYIAFFSLGAGPIPWLMMAELFPNDVIARKSMLDCLGRQLALLLHRDVHRQGIEGRIAVPRALLAIRRRVCGERHRGFIFGEGDEGEVAGRSHDDAPIADWERAAASATFVTDSIALFKRQDRRGLKEVL
jgi:SP family facilitated glucose transporter-like MFS transporter 8